MVVLAQEEARTLKHNYLGTEHILLGLGAPPRRESPDAGYIRDAEPSDGSIMSAADLDDLIAEMRTCGGGH